MHRKQIVATQFTALTFLVWSLYLLLVFFFIFVFGISFFAKLFAFSFMQFSATTLNVILLSVVVAYVLVFVAYAYYIHTIKRRVLKRADTLAALSAKNGWHFSASVDGVQPFHNASIMNIGKRAEIVRNFVQGPQWLYGEYEYAVYQRFKSGEYVASYVRYGIMAMQLPRELPHVVFDSVTVRGKQLGKQYDKKQLHTLEGDFSKFFNTYFAPTYTIDSLSFITPEVMLALRDAADYDIEIVGNQVLMYGPLFDAESQLTDMSQKLHVIYDKLMNNITTYRDDRLPYAEGRQTVAAMGRSLRPRRIIYWTVIINIIAFVIYLVVSLTQ